MGVCSKRKKRERESKRGGERKVVVKTLGWNDSQLSRQFIYDRRYDYMSEQCGLYPGNTEKALYRLDYTRENRKRKICKQRKVGGKGWMK